MASPDQLRVYLERFRNNPAGIPLQAAAVQALRAECQRVWGLMQRQPNTYTPTELEAAIFNAIADEATKRTQAARLAVERHYNARTGKTGRR